MTDHERRLRSDARRIRLRARWFRRLAKRDPYFHWWADHYAALARFLAKLSVA